MPFRSAIDGAAPARASTHERARSSDRSAERPERSAELGTEQLRLLPRGEVTALVDLVEVDQVAIGAAGPCLRGPIDLAREDRDGHRERDLGGLLRRRNGHA